VTTFAQQDPASQKVRLTVSAQVGAAGAQPGQYTVGYVVIDDANQVAGSFLTKANLSPGAGSPNEPLHFVGGVVLEPGIYSLRFGVVDDDGRRGSVVRDVNAWKMAGEPLAMGDLIIGSLPSSGQGLRPEVEPYVLDDRLAAYVELYSNQAATLDGASVAFELADDADGPALVTGQAAIGPGTQPTWRVALGLVGARMLPAGHYVARARIVRNGTTMTVLSRPLVIERPASFHAAFAPPPERFDRDSVMQHDLLDPVLQALEVRSPALKTALAEARAGRFSAAALEALSAGDSTAASLLRGIDLYAKGQLNEAATQLQAAAGPRRDFFPAALYLGACYAAAGRDRDAAGVWQFALGTEPRPARAYALAADARMRDGQAPSAIDILKPAYQRTPADDQLGRRRALAYVATGDHDRALPIIDAYLQRQPADPEMLFAAIVSRYEAMRAGQALSNAERERIRVYRAAYKGSDGALLDKYVALLDVR
jgi:Flp pilus assembly protein TadD